MYFVNDSVGYIASNLNNGNSVIIKTVDGGNTWQVIPLPWMYNTSIIHSVFFLDNNYGFISGQDFILKTLDGGNTWSDYVLSYNNTQYHVMFSDYNNGYLVGSNYSPVGSGTILKTNNGGSTWITDNSITDNSLYAIFLTDSSHIWAAGDCVTIIAKIDSSITTQTGKSFDNNINFKLYPNPSNNIITIEAPQPATIEISNIQGQLIKTIKASGNKINIDHVGWSSYVVDVSALPSGVYLVQVKTEKGVAVRKFVKE